MLSTVWPLHWRSVVLLSAFLGNIFALNPAHLSTVFEPGKTATGEKVGVVGATGYIGRNVVQQCLSRNYPTVAIVRDESKLTERTAELICNAEIREAMAVDRSSLQTALADCKVIICCLASRTGKKDDSWMVDYEASVNCLEAARAVGARHMVLLSAFCVRKPELEFQKAKLQTEAALASQDEVTYSIVRPTAYFKSLSGQVESVKGGRPYLYFVDNGRPAVCNPISECDLASAIVDCVADPKRNSRTGDPIWNIGGPEIHCMKSQGELIADAVARVQGAPQRRPLLVPVPIALYDFILNIFRALAHLFDSETLRDKVETAKIGRYYGSEDMLTTDPRETYGSITLLSHYERVVSEGLEYDPHMDAALTRKISSIILPTTTMP